METCWFLKSDPSPSTFVIGGKFGDCVQMIGAFYEIWKRTGNKVNVVCSSEFESVFDGCSFVNAVGIPVHWYEGLTKMKALAEARFGGAELLQFWHDTTSPEFHSARFQGGIVLQSHGINFSVDMSKDPHYGASMMRRAGFAWSDALKLCPVFDQRNPVREAELLNRCWPKALRQKPMLLVTFDGQSSPWGHLPEVHRIISPMYRHFHLVELSKIRANRVFDMLTLFENAAGLITVDTLALHLVSATALPYVAFTQNGWTGSVPKGNCVLEIKYEQSIQRMHDIPPVLEGWRDGNSCMVAMANTRPGHAKATGGGGPNMVRAAMAGAAR